MRLTIYPIVLLYILTSVLSLPLISKDILDPASQAQHKQWLGTRDAILADELSRRAGKITFSKHAYNQLDELGLHGKARKSAIKYNRKLVKNHMKNVHGAHSATIEHIAHVGGSTSKEPLHATVVYHGKPGHRPQVKTNPANHNRFSALTPKPPSHAPAPLIHSNYLHEGSPQRGVHHHVYANQKQHPLPAAYAQAEQHRLNNHPDHDQRQNIHYHS